MVLLLTVYWKADLALFRRPDLEKDKNKDQSSPEKYYSPGRNTEVKQTLIYTPNCNKVVIEKSKKQKAKSKKQKVK